MRKAIRTLALSLGTLLLAACSDLPYGFKEIQVSGEQHPALGDAIDQAMTSYMRDNLIPGATVAVTKNGRLVLWKGYGWADVAAEIPMQPWHRTRIGSVSKLLTAIAALQLVEDSVLDLEDHLYSSNISVTWLEGSDQPWLIYQPDGVLNSVGNYLSALIEAPQRLKDQPPAPPKKTPPFPYPPAYMQQDTLQQNVELLIDWASQIQIQHVLTHTAGFLRSGDVPKAQAYWENKGSLPGLLPSYPEIHAAMLAGVHDYPLLFSPGMFKRYSNHGYGVLGQIINDRSGMPYADYMQQRVFAPLGLNDIVSADVLDGRDATSYASYWKPISQAQLTEPVLGLATGGWAANAGALARILCAISRIAVDDRLLSAEMAREMRESRFVTNGFIGWDRISWGMLMEANYYTKSGRTPKRGGAARVSYYPSDEINVVVAFNAGFEGATPADGLLDTIATVVNTRIVTPFSSFDLFPEQSRCVPSSPGDTIAPPADGDSDPEPGTPGDIAIPTRQE